MNNKCNNCAKFLTCNRKKCNKITFVEAGILDKPQIIKGEKGTLLETSKKLGEKMTNNLYCTQKACERLCEAFLQMNIDIKK